MKRILYLLLIISVFAGCKKDAQTCCNPEPEEPQSWGYALANDSVPENFFYQEYNYTLQPNSDKGFDINADGKNDLNFYFYYSGGASHFHVDVLVTPDSTDTEIVVNTTSTDLIMQYNNGQTIDSTSNWSKQPAYIFWYNYVTGSSGVSRSKWFTDLGFLCVRIKKNGVYKYGWVKINYSDSPTTTTIISSLIEE